MMRNKSLIIITILFVQLVLVSCSSQSAADFPVPIAQTENCIDSFGIFAYTIPDLHGSDQGVVLPSSPWEVETSLPKELSMGWTAVEISRYIDDHIEIWIRKSPYTSYFSESDVDPYFFMIYRPDMHEWKRISAQVKGSNVFVDHLYLGADGIIWGRNVWARDADIVGQAVLSRYNEKTERFEFVQNTQVIPHGFKISGSSLPTWDEILVDPNGVFWIFVHKDAIYRYDPITQVVIRQTEITEYGVISQTVLAPDGSIYFTQRLLAKTLEHGQVLHFIPETGEINPVEIPDETWISPRSILIDRSGRLWLDTFGWEVDGKWHKLHPNMREFVREIANNDLWTEYYPPEIFTESSDSRIWFRIDRLSDQRDLRTGMAWLNPSTNEGCWFTTESTNIIEDIQHNLWMAVDGKLYTTTAAS